ncbi:MAG: hypothetical protein RTU63_04445 [Candidatus Thorarchaeota archaeon]
MAFEDGLGTDPSQQRGEDFAGSAYDITSRTVNLWFSKLVHYIIIVGIIGAACVALSYVLLLSLFGTVGTIGADPLTYFVNLFFTAVTDFNLIAVTLIFAVFAFILNAIIQGAAIKFTLDEYGGPGGDIGASFSHSLGRIVNLIIVQLILSFLTAIVLAPATSLAFQAIELMDLENITDPFSFTFPPGSIEMLMAAMGLFIVGGLFLLYFTVRLAPTLAVVIDTDLSAIDSLKKSWELTSGQFLHVFGSYILLTVVIIIIGVGFGFVLAFIPVTLEFSAVIQAVITALLVSSLSFIFTVVLYRDLSSRAGDSSVSSSLDNLRVT